MPLVPNGNAHANEAFLKTFSNFFVRNVSSYDSSNRATGTINKGLLLLLSKEDTPEKYYMWSVCTAKSDARWNSLLKALELSVGASKEAVVKKLLNNDLLAIHQINVPRKCRVLKATPGENPGVVFFEDLLEQENFRWAKKIIGIPAYSEGKSEETTSVPRRFGRKGYVRLEDREICLDEPGTDEEMKELIKSMED